ncbi:T9SS type A sorting domain-containing protein [Bacteroidota bacterium]
MNSFKTLLISIIITVFLSGNLPSYNINEVIWIPCSGKGTVVALHDSSYQVLGEYLTAPLSLLDSASPSRYAINYNGDVIFGHRKLGAITILHYKKGPGINTSTGLGNILSWPEQGPDDEAVIEFIHLPKFGDTRHISVTTDKKIIVGSTWTPNFFYIIDGTTYQIIDSITGTCGGGYGGITINEYLWSVSKNQNKTLKYNLSTGEQQCFDLPMSYGITSLPSGSVYNTLLNNEEIVKLSPTSDTIMARFPVGRTARGLTYNPYNERLYVANSIEDYITEMDTLGNITDSINLEDHLVIQTPPFRNPTGILVNQHDILITCFYQDTILVYNTQSNTVKEKIYIGPAANPYFYNSTTNLSHFYAEIVTVNTMDFHRELCEDERSDYITVTNSGFANLNVSDYEIVGENASYFDLASTQFPFMLESNESKNLAIWSYRPEEPGEITAILKLYSDAINADIDSSISIELRSEYQKIEHIVDGVESDTIFFNAESDVDFIDTILTIRNLSSIPSYIITKIIGNERFTMLNDTIFLMEILSTAEITIRFNADGIGEGWYYAKLTMEDECRTKALVLAASIHCTPQILQKDTIYACSTGDIIDFEPYLASMNVSPPIDSVYIISEAGTRYDIDEPISIEESMEFTIYVWSDGCWTEKAIWVDAPDVDYISEEKRLVIPGNPVVIGPNFDFESTFAGSVISYEWSPLKGIVYEFENGFIAVDPDSSTIYHLLITVDDKCEFTYRCTVEVSPCDVEDNLLEKGLVKVYPNPANEILSIDFSDYFFTSPIKIVMVNTLGIIVKDFEVSQYDLRHQMFVGDLSQGSYMLRIQSGGLIVNLRTVMIYR